MKTHFRTSPTHFARTSSFVASVAFVSCCVLLGLPTCASATEYSDDFANGINTNIWTASTTMANSAVSLVNGTVQLQSRGRLISVPPMPNADIQGRFRFTGDLTDELAVVLRTDGTFQQDTYEEAANGIFVVFQDGAVGIHDIAANKVASSSFSAAQNTFYDFRIVDSGTNIALYFNDSPVPTVSLSTTNNFGNKVVVYNRELSGDTTQIAFLTVNTPSALPAALVTLEFVTVGDPGNPPDSTVMLTDGTSGYGSVPSVYQIGKFEVTCSQYAAFLNAKAKSDPLGLYSSTAPQQPRVGGIVRNGTPGTYSYAVQSGFENRPVGFVSFYDAIRFCNWVNNGATPASDTEMGAYTLLGGTAIPTNASSITRNAGANVFLPNENEWYKAAYYQPSASGGPPGNYWKYATRNNEPPAPAAPSGDINSANYASAAPTLLTGVGSYTNSASFYGTFDQDGNVWEWNESQQGALRGMRGGGWIDGGSLNFSDGIFFGVSPGASVTLIASYRGKDNPWADDNSETGFRVAASSGPCFPHTATGVASVVNGFVVGITLTDGGCGYTNAPLVEILGGGGSSAVATAMVTNGVVTSIHITDAGIGYTNAPIVVIASPPFAPWLTIAVSQVAVTEHVVLGHNYVLESSSDMQNWTQVGAEFTAQSEVITQKLDVTANGGFFRLREVP
ncbi:MAG: formylglycine-generating enzyme family protein [Limisphaerales bacterium]